MKNFGIIILLLFTPCIKCCAQYIFSAAGVAGIQPGNNLQNSIGNAMGARFSYHYFNERSDDWHFGMAVSVLPFKSFSLYYNDELLLFRNALLADKLPAYIRGDISNNMYSAGPDVEFCPDISFLKLSFSAGAGITYLHSKVLLNDVSVSGWYISASTSYINRLVLKKNTAAYVNAGLLWYVYTSGRSNIYLQAGVMYTGKMFFYDYSNISTWKLDFKGEKYDRENILPQSIDLVDGKLPFYDSNMLLYTLSVGLQLQPKSNRK